MSDETRYTVPGDVLTAHLEGEAVLLHMDTKDYFRLNATAACVWKGLERGLDRQGLVDELCANFEVEPQAAGEELDRLLGELKARHLVAEA
ncbi:MAG TPA: PqqD family protein [Longimicrobiaceae bacterium]|nr:PqqD family protein [Longimicrobiaceae bacterium]